jgi:hypothetical protein
MAAGVIGLFVNRQVELLPQEMGAAQGGDSCSDDG